MKVINPIVLVTGLKVSRKTIFVFAFALGILLMASSDGKAQLGTGELVRTASLNGGSAGASIKGSGKYYVNRVTGWTPTYLAVDVSNVGLPNATVLAVFLGATQIGTISITSTGSGLLTLDPKRGQAVPKVADGAQLTVKNGSATILSGQFVTLNEAYKGCDD